MRRSFLTWNSNQIFKTKNCPFLAVLKTLFNLYIRIYVVKYKWHHQKQTVAFSNNTTILTPFENFLQRGGRPLHFTSVFLGCTSRTVNYVIFLCCGSKRRKANHSGALLNTCHGSMRRKSTSLTVQPVCFLDWSATGFGCRSSSMLCKLVEEYALWSKPLYRSHAGRYFLYNWICFLAYLKFIIKFLRKN